MIDVSFHLVVFEVKESWFLIISVLQGRAFLSTILMGEMVNFLIRCLIIRLCRNLCRKMKRIRTGIDDIIRKSKCLVSIIDLIGCRYVYDGENT